MEIEPEVLPPEDGDSRRARSGPAPRRMALLPTLLFGGAALVIGGVFFFFMFWVFAAFAALGLTLIGINTLRRLLTGAPPGEGGNVRVWYSIDRNRGNHRH